MDESTPTPQTNPDAGSDAGRGGLRYWLLAIPMALASAVLIPIAFDLYWMWGFLIYVITGALTGLSFATYAAFSGRRRKIAQQKAEVENAQLELERTGS